MDNEKFKDSVIKKLEDLCDRMARMEEKIAGHLDSNEKRATRKREVIFIIIAVVSTIVAIAQAFI